MIFKSYEVKKDNSCSGSQASPLILYVEDDTIAQYAMLYLFNKMGCMVDLAVNGLEALNKYLYSNQQYDLVILDGGLPKLSGFDIAKQIRLHEQGVKKNNPQSPRTPLVLLSAYPYEQVQYECRCNGIDDFAIKPVSFEDVRKIVTKWLNRNKSN